MEDNETIEKTLPAVPQTALMMYMSAAAAYAGSFFIGLNTELGKQCLQKMKSFDQHFLFDIVAVQ